MKIAGVEFDGKVNLTSVIAVVMAFTAMVGGWYKFDARVTATEKSITYLQEARQKDQEDRDKLQDTLNSINYVVGQLKQRLDDDDKKAGR
jgi:hypothetical protein